MATVTLTLDGDQLEELRRTVGARSLSTAVDSAVAAYLARLRHLAAVDDWLVELERASCSAPHARARSLRSMHSSSRSLT